MKNITSFITILLLVVCNSIVFTSCTKEENETTTLTVYARCKYSQSYYPYKVDTVDIKGADIYLYKDIDISYWSDIKYEYQGNGILKNKTTGAEVSYWKKETSVTTRTYFKDLPNGTYAVVVDISKLDTESKTEDWNGMSINLPENIKGYEYNNALNFVFDISPWKPWDIGL